MPEISIILPTYNWEKYISKTIESVLSQNFKNFEIIIVNDCSTDNTEEIIKNFKDIRIIYIKNDKNLNIVWSRNKWLEIVKWKYICFLDHDDLFIDNEKLKLQYDFLEKNIDYGMIWSSAILINENWNKTWEINSRITNEDIKNHLIMSNQFTCWSVMFRKNLIEKIWLLNNKYNKSDDYDYWLKIWKIYKVENISNKLFAYRIHSNNTTFQGFNRYKMIYMWFKLALIHWKKYPNFYKQIALRFFWDFIIPNKLLWLLIKIFKNKI